MENLNTHHTYHLTLLALQLVWIKRFSSLAILWLYLRHWVHPCYGLQQKVKWKVVVLETAGLIEVACGLTMVAAEYVVAQRVLIVEG